jgi:hypothetical protein
MTATAGRVSPTTSTRNLARLLEGPTEGNWMKLAARLVALVLLLAPATASAECAWVLWEAKEDFNAGLNHLDVSWTILRTYDALNGCREDQAKLLAGDTAWMPYPGKTRLDDGFSVSIRESGKLIRTIKQRALCVPDTVDPRGPKGGGR